MEQLITSNEDFNMEKPEFLVTALTAYSFNCASDAYYDMLKNVDSRWGIHPMMAISNDTITGKLEHGEQRIVHLSTKHSFNNQYNTTEDSPNFPNTRVFDRFEKVFPDNRSLKIGYYLEITPEIQFFKDNEFRCGYCGKSYWMPGKQIFCESCLGSVYLKEEELYLLRLKALSDFSKRPKIRAGTFDWLYEIYLASQNRTSEKMLLKKIEQHKEDVRREEEYALFKTNVLNWFLENKFPFREFHIWRGMVYFGGSSVQRLSDSEKEKIKGFLLDWNFPYPYEIKN